MTAIKKYISAAAMLIILLCFITAAPVTVFAAETEYTGVLEDLKKDSTFDENQYAANSNDYSLQIIQIAESESNELFIYVYQPSGAGEYWRATSINISTAINENYSPKNYTLTLIDSSGVFAKYLVDDLTVKSDSVRYYDIPSIYRKFINGYDDTVDNNITNEVAYKAAQLWTACTLNGECTYVCETTEVVVIETQYAGHIYYADGFPLVQYTSACDRWFVAFSCDYDIDFLYEADVSYHQTYHYKRSGLAGKEEVTDEGIKNITLTYDEVGSNNHNSPFITTFEWKRISSMEDFLNEDGVKGVITDEAIQRISGNDWVLSFTETPRSYWYDDYSSSQTWYNISEVTILRLEFQIAEEHYNLGVVSNKQTSVDIDGVYDPGGVSPNDWLWWLVYVLVWFVFVIIAIVIVIAAVMLLISLAPSISVAILKLFAKIGKGIVKVVTLPFRAIATLFRKE